MNCFGFRKGTNNTIGGDAANVILREGAAWVVAAESYHRLSDSVLGPKLLKELRLSIDEHQHNAFGNQSNHTALAPRVVVERLDAVEQVHEAKYISSEVVIRLWIFFLDDASVEHHTETVTDDDLFMGLELLSQGVGKGQIDDIWMPSFTFGFEKHAAREYLFLRKWMDRVDRAMRDVVGEVYYFVVECFERVTR